MSKESWPELVGLGWREAETRIRQEYPRICIQVLADGSVYLTDFCEERVRVFIDKDDKVTKVPKIG